MDQSLEEEIEEAEEVSGKDKQERERQERQKARELKRLRQKIIDLQTQRYKDKLSLQLKQDLTNKLAVINFLWLLCMAVIMVMWFYRETIAESVLQWAKTAYSHR